MKPRLACPQPEAARTASEVLLGSARPRTRLSNAVGDSNRDKGEHHRMRRMTLVAVVAVTALAALAAGAANSAGVKTSAQAKSPVQKAVFFAADGMRQDIVARYAAQGLMPTMSDFLKKGTSASGNGLLTQAPPNTGAGWYSLATGAWPGVHGSTNNTFHRNGQPFANRTAAFDPGRSRPSRSPSRPSEAASRSRRSSGPAAATRRSAARPSTSSPSSRAAASRRTSSARPVSRCSTMQRTSRPSGCSSTIRPATRDRLPTRARSRRRPSAGRARFRRRTAPRARCISA